MWVKAIEKLTAGQVIAVEGKQLRRSHDHDIGKAAIYMVSAWATANQIVLGQRKVDEKPNEITAIPELLKLLEISGCIVTIDAIGTQTEIAQTIVNGGGAASGTYNYSGTGEVAQTVSGNGFSGAGHPFGWRRNHWVGTQNLLA